VTGSRSPLACEGESVMVLRVELPTCDVAERPELALFLPRYGHVAPWASALGPGDPPDRARWPAAGESWPNCSRRWRCSRPSAWSTAARWRLADPPGDASGRC